MLVKPSKKTKPADSSTAVKARRKNPMTGFEKALAKVSNKLAPALKKAPEQSREIVKTDKRGLHMRENPPSSEKMKKIRAMRQIYGKQMPRLQCNTCQFSTNCPSFRAGYECAYLPFLSSHKIESLDDVVNYMREVVGSNIQRLHLASIFERISGGTPSTELNEAYAMAFQQLASLKEAEQAVPASAQAGGKDSIIGNLFGNINILIQTTGKHHKEIAADMAGVIVEEGGTPALTSGGEHGRSVDDLVAELQNPDAIPVSPRPKHKQPTTTLSQGEIKT